MNELSIAFPQVRTIIFSAYSDHAFVDRVTESAAWACLSKVAEPSEIFRVLREVAAGNHYFPRINSRR